MQATDYEANRMMSNASARTRQAGTILGGAVDAGRLAMGDVGGAEAPYTSSSGGGRIGQARVNY